MPAEGDLFARLQFQIFAVDVIAVPPQIQAASRARVGLRRVAQPVAQRRRVREGAVDFGRRGGDGTSEFEGASFGRHTTFYVGRFMTAVFKYALKRGGLIALPVLFGAHLK